MKDFNSFNLAVIFFIFKTLWRHEMLDYQVSGYKNVLERTILININVLIKSIWSQFISPSFFI